MSRHTPVPANGITRSYGLDPETGEDLVVEMRPGEVEFRKEPTDRRLRRNEKLPSLTLKVQEVMDNLKAPIEVPKGGGEVKDILEQIAARAPVADFGLDSKAQYSLKVWLLNELAKVIEEQNG